MQIYSAKPEVIKVTKEILPEEEMNELIEALEKKKVGYHSNHVITQIERVKISSFRADEHGTFVYIVLCDENSEKVCLCVDVVEKNMDGSFVKVLTEESKEWISLPSHYPCLVAPSDL